MEVVSALDAEFLPLAFLLALLFFLVPRSFLLRPFLFFPLLESSESNSAPDTTASAAVPSATAFSIV